MVMIHLQSVRVRNPDVLPDGYPFSIPIIQKLDELDFTAPVTFLVGENGSGKSSLIEAIAASANLPTVGSVAVADDETLNDAQALSRHLVLSWSKRNHRGFYLRSEDFFGFALNTSRTIDELGEIAKDFEPGSYAHSVVMGQRSALAQNYGELNTVSHGESFFSVFGSRLTGNGLYLLDEPEVALSPQRQIALLALLKDTVANDGQFVIATHSPILMAYPDAQILHLSENGIHEQAWADVEHVSMTRDFLTNPELFLRHL